MSLSRIERMRQVLSKTWRLWKDRDNSAPAEWRTLCGLMFHVARTRGDRKDAYDAVFLVADILSAKETHGFLLRSQPQWGELLNAIVVLDRWYKAPDRAMEDVDFILQTALHCLEHISVQNGKV